MSRTVRRVRVPGSFAEHAQQHIGHIDMDAPEVVMIMLAPRGDVVRFGTSGLRMAVVVQPARIRRLTSIRKSRKRGEGVRSAPHHSYVATRGAPRSAPSRPVLG